MRSWRRNGEREMEGKGRGRGEERCAKLPRAVESVVGQQGTRGVFAVVLLSVATTPGNTSQSPDSSVCVCVST